MKPDLTPEQIKAMFPHASPSLLRANGVTCQQSIKLPEPAAEVVKEMRSAAARGIRPTTDIAKLNKLEQRYLRFLEGQQPAWLGVQCITLKIGHDCRYTPDFWAIDNDGIRAIDTKGEHVWEDSMIKMRCAARLYPWVRILLAKENGLVWDHKEIKP